MRVIFMGTPRFACPTLATLAESRHDVVMVVTRPDERAKRGRKMVPTAVKQTALDHSLPVLTPVSLKDKGLRENLTELQADLIVVVAFKILPRAIFTLPRLGSMNIHASLLPKYRGAAPINWALINGERETGLTSFILDKTVDTGNIILQEKIAIEQNENFDSLYSRLSDHSAGFALRSIDLLEQSSFTPFEQNHAEATPAPKITAENAMIDFGFPAHNVVNFVRGLATIPGAYTYFRKQKVKILACKVAEPVEAKEETSSLPPGTLICQKGRLLVQCANSTIEILTVLPQGRKMMDGRSFINGLRPTESEQFGLSDYQKN